MNVPRVYALGNAPLVHLMCHELASLSFQPKVPEVVLLLQDQKKLNRFLENESKVEIQRNNGGFDGVKQYMASCSPPKFASGEIARIDNLIIGENNPRSFIDSIKKYTESIDCDTNLLLLNPNMGVRDMLRKNIWHEQESLPNLFMGITNLEDVCRTAEFTIQFPGFHEALQVCSVPKTHMGYSYEQDVRTTEKLSTTNSLSRLLKSVNKEETGSAMGVVSRPYGDLLLYRYEELIVRSCVAPISVMYGQQAHDLQASDSLTKMIRTLVAEFTYTIKATDKFIPLIPHSKGALDQHRLFSTVSRHFKKTKYRDFRRPTINDINLSNGFFALKARKLNIRSPLNDTIMACAKAKLQLARKSELDYRYL
ncbi:LANO_0G07800g1_1 [Lachancea nothofagi CBS 11611]|uniref:LANO_0G07800g1_1 n=1 Tax=Lachancea nothofagi CBS 11611 TaxID=1266666 RepID=A0A1G4KI28_9SACH|nr:LANO_0G07800g1_1 [Lachancea nothofagi CBS 11611]